jgi:uncharacterized protein (DUF1697 family)
MRKFPTSITPYHSMNKKNLSTNKVTYVALLRGINVGGNKKVEMSKLKEVFTSMGFKNVSTYINSGNVIFDSNKKDFSQLEKVLEKSFGFEIKVVIRDAENIKNLCQKISQKFQNNAEQKTDVLFLWDEFDKKSTLSLLDTNPAVDTLQYIPGAIVWSLQKSNYGKSGMRNFIGTKVYKNMTARNINTVRKLGEIMAKNAASP